MSIILSQLENVIMPWKPTLSNPCEWVRKTATGTEIAIVTSWLGGYADPHQPECIGWGYKAHPYGNKAICTNGIYKSDYPYPAQTIVDKFLSEHYPEFTLLEPVKVYVPYDGLVYGTPEGKMSFYNYLNNKEEK